MARRVTLIPGDGIGREVVAAAQRVIAAAGVAIEWEEQLAGADALSKVGDPLPAATLESIRRNKLALTFGASALLRQSMPIIYQQPSCEPGGPRVQA